MHIYRLAREHSLIHAQAISLRKFIASQNRVDSSTGTEIPILQNSLTLISHLRSSARLPALTIKKKKNATYIAYGERRAKSDTAHSDVRPSQKWYNPICHNSSLSSSPVLSPARTFLRRFFGINCHFCALSIWKKKKRKFAVMRTHSNDAAALRTLMPIITQHNLPERLPLVIGSNIYRSLATHDRNAARSTGGNRFGRR